MQEDFTDPIPTYHPLRRYEGIAHYYGDHVRILFLVTAVIALITIPVWGNLLPFGTTFEVAGMVLLVFLAGLTSPHGQTVLWVDAVLAGVGVILLESAAINFYSTQSIELFLAREVSVLLLAFAFYWSVKTVRAIMQGKLGQLERPWEFETGKEE